MTTGTQATRSPRARAAGGEKKKRSVQNEDKTHRWRGGRGARRHKRCRFTSEHRGDSAGEDRVSLAPRVAGRSITRPGDSAD